MSIGWYDDLAEAETYFTDERLETTAWDALSDGTGSGTKDEKTAVLKMAYNRLYYAGPRVVPDVSSATASELVILKQAQAEMAYYLSLHLASEDRRKGLQAQAVTDAGVVKESYKEGGLNALPIPAVVLELLKDFTIRDTAPFYAADIDRDEDYSVAEDVTDLE